MLHTVQGRILLSPCPFKQRHWRKIEVCYFVMTWQFSCKCGSVHSQQCRLARKVPEGPKWFCSSDNRGGLTGSVTPRRKLISDLYPVIFLWKPWEHGILHEHTKEVSSLTHITSTRFYFMPMLQIKTQFNISTSVLTDIPQYVINGSRFHLRNEA